MFKVTQPSEVQVRRMGLSPQLVLAPTTMWLPEPALASCVRAMVSRSTLGVRMSNDQRYNHFPATPTCSLVWYLQGECEEIAPGFPARDDSPRSLIPGRTFFSGPRNRPFITRNPGPMHAVMLLLLPDALSLLTGIDPGDYVNRMVPVEQVFDADWQSVIEAVVQASDDAQRVELMRAFLLPRWQQLRPETSLPARLFADWSQSLALRAANSGWGRSARQVERRIKQWTGQPLRELRGVGRSERAFFEAVTALENGSLDWTEIANTAGYSDQSHFCRQSRRITGFSPDELRKRIATDESFWVYRVWGFSESGADG